MELVEDKYISNFCVKKYHKGSIFISDKSYSDAIIFYEDSISEFPIANPKIISITDLEEFLLTVDLILIGTGVKNILLNQDLIQNMQGINKGLEFMNTESACKTHNLLLSEKRSFASILYP